jgi:ribosomal protein S18 acetylase RimI-like enzyme
MHNPAVKIRQAQSADLEDLTRLLQDLFTIETDFAPDPQRQRSGLEQLMKSSGAVILVAEIKAEVVGMCSVQTVISTAEGGPSGWLEDMIVKADMRKRGIGKALLAAAQKWAEEKGMTRLQLLSESDNEAALKFYFKNRWQWTGLVCRRKMIKPGK